ncbi:capping protein-inhibiting regulator of actin dynamics isoform X2 [Paralichthys olivaceus]|uniref:capping protein-inhibiting regulator of actin dynamics isoform X2 n=1 Tax=Paralichthys olivaceus TaxID=8255 RepID=UPI00374FF3B2
MKRRMSPWGAGHGRSSDSAAMASGPPDVMANQEPAEVQEECSGKKKSKFQTFKKFFARKKKKEPSAAGEDTGLKASQSSDNVSKTSENNALTRSEKDKGSGSKISLGCKALSHDSVFVSDSSEANEALGASQDSIHGKVKSLQLQLKQAIRLGSPPSLMCVKRADDPGTMSEDDGLPCSPPEYTTLHTAMNQAQRNSSISLEGIDDDDQLSCAASSRAMSPLVVPGDFSQPASPFGCLDNSAAKHKRGLRLKACNKRKPTSRLEGKTEGDSVADEMLDTSVTDAAEEQEEQKSEAVSFDELKPQVEREEEEEEEEEEGEGEGEEEDMEEEKEQSQHSRQSLLRYKEEREEREEGEEGEDESESEEEISHSPDISSPPEPSLSEEEAPGAQPPPSSEPSSRASSLESPRATPEPPAGPREYLLDPPGIAYGAEKKWVESALALRMDEDEVQENREEEEEEDEDEEEEEESSFLQEVLSSLKTPLTSCSLRLETENVVLEMKEEKMVKELAEMEDGEKVEEEEEEEDEPVDYQAASSLMLGHTTEKEEEVSVRSSEEEVVPVEEEAESDEEEEEAPAAAAEEEEELVVELFVQHSQEEEEAAAEKEDVEEVEPEEENDVLSRKSDIHAQEDRREEEGEREEEVMELEKEPQVDEEGSEKREEEEEVKGVSARVEEAEEAIEEESKDAEEMMDNLPDAADEEVGITVSLQERDECVEAVVRDDATEHTGDDEIQTELGDQVVDKVQEGEENPEIVEEEEEIELSEEKSDQEADVETKHPDVDETEEENREGLSSIDTKQEDQTEATAAVPAHPSSLSLQEFPHETPSQESGAVSPSKTSMLHINLVSPSSEKNPSFFQQSPTAEDVKDNITEPPSQLAAATEDEQADTVEEVEEEKQPTLEVEEEVEEVTPPASLEETTRPSSGSDQSKARFTITPAWQRPQSLTPPSSPPAVACSPTSPVAGHGGEEVEAAAKMDPDVKAEPAGSPKVELVLSPGRARNAGSTAVRPQSNTSPSPACIKPQSSAAASTEENSVVVEGNPDNPFGVRLRKTSTLHLFSSEDENTESPIESPIQPTSCKAEPPQPIGVKPSIIQPISNKPALPKKPDVHGDGGVKSKSISDPAAAAARGVSGGSDSPSWISVAKQKQRIYKENSLEEITVKKDEPERKSSLPMYVSSVASREQGNKTAESSSKEMSKPSASVDKETRRSFSPPTPVPPQPSKTQSLPCPVPPKPLVPPAAAKPPAQPTPDHRSHPAPTPVPVPHKSPSCTSPPSLSKPATFSPSSNAPQPQSSTVPSTPFSSRTTPEKSPTRAAGVSGQTPSSQRGLPPTALPQDEPPWMALAKKKAKAWSEMPQIVQ